MEVGKLTVTLRNTTGHKGASRKLRATGKIPGVCYGASPDGSISNKIDGENCYGAEKLRMVSLWLETQNIGRGQCSIAAYSDHPSDAPLLDWADKAYAINPGASFAETAARQGWTILNFRDPGGDRR